ncbi:hypothetical protein Thiofri_01366 [Thiorhodovibrio frisius]|nr:hypothetical protein Thiofri_01366 [Thiorhodovibrio frisius]
MLECELPPLSPLPPDRPNLIWTFDQEFYYPGWIIETHRNIVLKCFRLHG